MAERLPAWALDIGVALLLAAVGLGVERLTEGRLFTESILLWVGGGTFVLLRLGARLAQMGRTLGCGFVFLITWLLPCVLLLYMISNSHLQRVIRDSPAFFLYLGLVLILIMLLTFERVRQADVARYERHAPG